MTGWDTAARFLIEVARASGFDLEADAPSADLTPLLDHLRRLSADLPCREHGIERRRCGCSGLPS